MVKVVVTRKVFVNSKNKQLSINIPKKEFRKIDPKLDFSKELFVRLEILRRKRNG